MIIDHLNKLIGKMNANGRGQVIVRLHDCSLAFNPGVSLKVDKDYQCVSITGESEYHAINVNNIDCVKYKFIENEDSTIIGSEVESSRVANIDKV